MNINTLKVFLKKVFKRKYPYSPVAYLGRKTVERSLGADIVKLKKIDDAKVQAKQERGEKRKKKRV